MQNLALCITCQNPLPNNIVPIPNKRGFASCKTCGACYQIHPVTNNLGMQLMDKYGRAVWYFNPVRPGRPGAYHNPNIVQYDPAISNSTAPMAQVPKEKPNFSKTKDAIKDSKSVQDFINFLNLNK